MPPRAQGKLGLAEERKFFEEANDDSDWRRCSQAAMHFGGPTPRWETEHVAEHGEHAGELARLADPTSSGSPDRPGGLDQRSLCDERVGGGGLAGSSALGAHRWHRQSAQAEDGPPGCPGPGAQGHGDGAGPVAGGLVSTSADSRAAAAGSAALLGGGAADAGQEPGAQSAADVGTVCGDQPLHRLGSNLAEGTEAVRSHARERGAAPALPRFSHHRTGEERDQSARHGEGLSRDRPAADPSRTGSHSLGGDLERDRGAETLRLPPRAGELHRAGAELVRERRTLGARGHYASKAGVAALGADHGGGSGGARREKGWPAPPPA